MNKKLQHLWIVFFVLVPLFAILVAGCTVEPDPVIPTATQGTSIPFETIENAETSGLGGAYDKKEPKLVVVTDLDEVVALNGTISENAQAALQKLNFEQSFVLVVFQGKKGSGSFQVDIRQMVQEGNQLIIFAHFTEPQPDHVVTMGETSPYHLIEVQKNKIDITGVINFILNVDGDNIIQEQKSIP
ncbi:MAG: hypothetical protein Fur0022_20300 [Anaerolineales bacterium]